MTEDDGTGWDEKWYSVHGLFLLTKPMYQKYRRHIPLFWDVPIWLATRWNYNNNLNSFCIVCPDGSANYSGSRYSYGLAPAFFFQKENLINHLSESKDSDTEDDFTIKENEVYQEIELFRGDVKIGEAEVDTKGKMLSRLSIYEPYQNKGYGTEIVKKLTEKYGMDNLWVNADNKRAIHVYEKCGYKIKEPTMYQMEVSDD